VAVQIKLWKWNFIRHTTKKDSYAIEKQALGWNPQRQHRGGRPRRSWRRMIDEKAEIVGKTWREVTAIAGKSLLALLNGRGPLLQSGVTGI
jgi:hypothetical protein